MRVNLVLSLWFRNSSSLYWVNIRTGCRWRFTRRGVRRLKEKGAVQMCGWRLSLCLGPSLVTRQNTPNLCFKINTGGSFYSFLGQESRNQTLFKSGQEEASIHSWAWTDCTPSIFPNRIINFQDQIGSEQPRSKQWWWPSHHHHHHLQGRQAPGLSTPRCQRCS